MRWTPADREILQRVLNVRQILDLEDVMRLLRSERSTWLIAIVVSIATFMVFLDTAIANVSLRYIAGSVAVSVDEST
jgi:hypothetical protein